MKGGPDKQMCAKICSEFVDVLYRLRENNDPVTIIIKSGAECCSQTGCIGEIVDDCYLTLVSGNNACIRTYIPLNCICTVITPAENEVNNEVNEPNEPNETNET